MKKQKNKIALALGSGSVRGFAHLGVLKSLAENDIPISYISGTSIGSLVAAYYARHLEVASLTDIILGSKKNFYRLADLGWRNGLVSGARYEKYIEHILGKDDFEDTKIPLRIVATDLATGLPYVFSKGKLSVAVRASASVPIVFQPVKDDKKSFVDGALSEPVPVESLLNFKVDKIIAVNLYHNNEFVEKKFNLTKVALRSTRIALYNLAKHSVRESSLVLNPDTSKLVQMASLKNYFSRTLAEEMIEIGYQETNKNINKIKSWL